MKESGSQFLHERQPNLHASREVEAVVGYLRAGGESIPNQPADKISAYLGFLADRDYVNDGILTGDQASIDRQIEAHVIRDEDVPEGYFDLQRRIAREQGHGDITITKEMRQQLVEAVQADQRAGLSKWIEYLGGEDGSYPAWFKHYVFESIIKTGNYDKEKGEFLKRSKGTTAPYPELNREALAYVYSVLHKSKVQGERVDGGVNDEKLQKLLKSANFGKLYAHAMLEVTPDSPELRKDIVGSWTKFDRTDDPRIARRLSGSLQGHGTGWCTAGEPTANAQLTYGDFYVYYTRGEDGKDTIPRIAIRMDNGKVAEARGINPNQNLEPDMIDIATEQLKDLPGGEEYIRKAEDMKGLTEIEKKITTDPETGLTPEELRFLYEMDRKIQGFGYFADPRIEEIRYRRDYITDMSVITGTSNHTDIALRLIDDGQDREVGWNLGKFTGLDESVAHKLIDTGHSDRVAKYLAQFTGLDHTDIADRLIEAGAHVFLASNLDKFTGLDHTDIANIADRLIGDGKGYSVAENLDKFTGLDHTDIAHSLVYSEQEHALAYNLDKFTGLDERAANRLVRAGYGEDVADNLDKFTGLDHNDIANSLIEAEQGLAVAHNLDKFTGLDHTDIAKRLFAYGLGLAVARNLDKFTGLDHNDIARRLFNAGEGQAVAENIDKFSSLDESIANLLVKAGFSNSVTNNPNSFKRLP